MQLVNVKIEKPDDTNSSSLNTEGSLCRGLPANFLVMDAQVLKDWSKRFDNLIDSGLFHVFNDEDSEVGKSSGGPRAFV